MCLEPKAVLEAKNVSKHYSGVVALKNVNMQFRKGEVHAIVGENGAGKSTLMNVLSGVCVPEEGSEILYRDKRIKLKKPEDARNYGISMIHQENSLVQHLTVYENIFLGHFETKHSFLDKKKMVSASSEFLRRLQIDYIDPTSLVKDLSSSEKQLIEITKAISLNPQIIIMDEPTASLTFRETETLMKIIAELKASNVAIIYISHRMEEVFQIADVISVLRDGEHIGTYPAKEINVDEVIALMVDRKVSQNVDEKTSEKIELSAKSIQNPVILSVEGLTWPGRVENASFELHKGEILGFAGLVGAGRSEIMEMIYGHVTPSKGKITYQGKAVHFHSPADAVKAGIGMLTEDRKLTGILPLHSVEDNINISIMPRLKNGLLLSDKKQTKNASDYIRKINIKTPDQSTRISNLSGGNQQKVLLARMLSINPQILILDEPTHGIDIGAKTEIYGMINKLASQGISILLISSELPELISLSHRIVVMYEGKIKAKLECSDFSQETIMNYASNLAVNS
jgi:ABC-type sugar transport system ATPase subunit